MISSHYAPLTPVKWLRRGRFSRSASCFHYVRPIRLAYAFRTEPGKPRSTDITQSRPGRHRLSCRPSSAHRTIRAPAKLAEGPAPRAATGPADVTHVTHATRNDAACFLSKTYRFASRIHVVSRGDTVHVRVTQVCGYCLCVSSPYSLERISPVSPLYPATWIAFEGAAHMGAGNARRVKPGLSAVLLGGTRFGRPLRRIEALYGDKKGVRPRTSIVSAISQSPRARLRLHQGTG